MRMIFGVKCRIRCHHYDKLFEVYSEQLSDWIEIGHVGFADKEWRFTVYEKFFKSHHPLTGARSTMRECLRMMVAMYLADAPCESY